jgi:Rieske [2Fe-2S] domain
MIDYKHLVQDDRIHASLYADPQVFDDEMERIFHRGWVFVGHDSEIPRPGDYVTRVVGREPVIMVRAGDGLISVLVNRCRHRGTMVCPADRGHARTLTCPTTAGPTICTVTCSGCRTRAATPASTRAPTASPGRRGCPPIAGSSSRASPRRASRSPSTSARPRGSSTAPATSRRLAWSSSPRDGSGAAARRTGRCCRRTTHQGGGAGLGPRPHRDRLVARLRGLLRMARKRLRLDGRALRGRARAPGRTRGSPTPLPGRSRPRAHLPESLPGRDQHRHRPAGVGGGVRALAHPDVLDGRARVERPAAPHGRGRHGPRVVPDAGRPDHRGPQPAGPARPHELVAAPGPRAQPRGGRRRRPHRLPRHRRDDQPGLLAPLPHRDDGG